MVRPEAFHEAHVTLRNVPYTCVDGSSQQLPWGGVLGKGKLVWTKEAPPVWGSTRAVPVFADGVGLVMLEPQGLVRADVLQAH